MVATDGHRATLIDAVGGSKAGRYDSARLRSLVDSCRPRYDTAQDLALGAIRQAILEGILPPGTRLRQEDLAEAFGTSRIPIREALRVLAYEGLVHSIPYRGFTVTSLPGVEQIEEIYDLRTVLEAHAVRLAVSLLTDADLEDLRRIHDAMVHEEDEDRQFILREEFYLRLYSVTARPRLIDLIFRLRQDVARSLRWKLVQHSPAHHDRFWDAICEADADRAVAELTSHYGKVAALIRRFLREPDQRHGDLIEDYRAAPRSQS
jgi:DNA-binding GntR family transcriptional regulator